jgi:hypothetical protein
LEFWEVIDGWFGDVAVFGVYEAWFSLTYCSESLSSLLNVVSNNVHSQSYVVGQDDSTYKCSPPYASFDTFLYAISLRKLCSSLKMKTGLLSMLYHNSRPPP